MPLPFSIVCLCAGVLACLLRWSDAPASLAPHLDTTHLLSLRDKF
jgi:hypothetical protein